MVLEYIRRNLPVFVIGIVTVAVFLIIILVSNRSPNSQSLLPALRKVSEDELSTQFDETQIPTTQFITPQDSPSTLSPTEEQAVANDLERNQAYFEDAAFMSSANVKQTYGVLEITFTLEQGFTPRKAKGYRYQTARIINDSDANIVLSQTGKKYSSWTDDKALTPGEFVEFDLEDTGLWTYIEEVNNMYGSINVEKAVNI